MSSIYDDVINAANGSEDFDGLFDEAYTRLIEHITEVAKKGKKEYRWLEYQYPSVRGEVNAELLADWLLRDGFRVAYVQDSEPRIWVVKWEDKHE